MCYICNQKWHFAKQCPKRQQKLLAQIEQTTDVSLEDADIESIFSVEEKPSSKTICWLEGWNTLESATYDPENEEIYTI